MQVTTDQETESRLPTPVAYYRPARAKALRQQARWLAWGHAEERLFCAILMGTVGFGILALAALHAGPLVMLLMLLGMLLALAAPCYLSHWAARLEAEANALEREHEARYGVLPAAEES